MAAVRMIATLRGLIRPPGGAAGRALALSIVVDSVGRGVYLAGSIVFFTRVVGLSAPEVGAGLAIAGVAGLLATFPVGLLADRLGARRVLVGLQVYRALGLAAYTLVDSFAGFAVVAGLIGIAAGSAVPVLQALVASAVPADQRVTTMGYLRSVQNAGFAVGGVLAAGAIALETGSSYLALVLANAVSFVFSAAVLARVPVTAAPPPAVRTAPLQALRDRPVLAAAALNGVLNLNANLLIVGVPLWILTRTTLPAFLVAAVFVLNTVLAVALQVPVSATAATPAGSALAFRRAGLALAVTCLLLLAAGYRTGWSAAALLVAAVVALTFGEMLQSAAAWGSCYALAPADRRGSYLSVFNLGVNGQLMAGPIIVTLAVTAGAVGWLALAAVFAVAGPVAAVVVRRGLAGRPVDVDAPALAGGRS